MSLPPLPDLPLVFTTTESDVHKLMREYGALCRKMALEEAAKVCEKTYSNGDGAEPWFHVLANHIGELAK